MIYREPIPLLEAFHFFRAQKFGFSLKDYLDNLIKRHPTHEKEYDEYFVHLFAVTRRLREQRSMMRMTDVLFGPLSTKGRRASNRGRGDCIADLLIEEVSVFCREDPFAVIRGRPEMCFGSALRRRFAVMRRRINLTTGRRRPRLLQHGRERAAHDQRVKTVTPFQA
ncbi:MAG: hypothetical protein ACLUZ4_00605 [Christensenellaceae bacterium]